MQIVVRRHSRTERCVMSNVFIDGEPMFAGIESVWLPGEREWELHLRWSPSTHMWVLAHPRFPGHGYMEIRPGNKPEDAENALIIGDGAHGEYITGADASFNKLMGIVLECIACNDRVTITYRDAYEESHVHAATA